MCSSSPSPELSAIVVSHNEGEQLRETVHELLATVPMDSEVIVVDDDSTDRSASALRARYPTVEIIRTARRVGVAAARNLGARLATGELLVFSDAHVSLPHGWVEPLACAARRPGVGAVAPAIAAMGNDAARGYGRTWRDARLRSTWLGFAQPEPHAVPLLCGCFMAMPRAVFEDCGGFDDGLAGWGAEDDELSVRLWTVGYECQVVPEVVVSHRFRSRHPYAVEPAQVAHNYLRMALVHLTGPRLSRVLAAQSAHPDFTIALAAALDGDLCARRVAVHSRRTRDDQAYWMRFGIDGFEEEQA